MISETCLFGVIENPIPARPLPTEAIPDSVSIGPEDIDLSWRGDGKYFASVSRAQTGRCEAELTCKARMRPLLSSCRNESSGTLPQASRHVVSPTPRKVVYHRMHPIAYFAPNCCRPAFAESHVS